MIKDISLSSLDQAAAQLPAHIDPAVAQLAAGIAEKLVQTRADALGIEQASTRENVSRGPTAEDLRTQVEGLRTVLAATRREIRVLCDRAQELPRLADERVVAQRAALLGEQADTLLAMLRRLPALLNALEQRHSAAERTALLQLGSGQSANEALRDAQRRAREAGDQGLKQAAATASNDLTHALLAAEQMLEMEIERSREIATAVASSTAVLRTVGSEHRALGGILQQSRRLVTRLAQRDWTDRLLLVFGFGLFIMASFYVVRRRFYVPWWSTIWELLVWVFRLASSLVASIGAAGTLMANSSIPGPLSTASTLDSVRAEFVTGVPTATLSQTTTTAGVSPSVAAAPALESPFIQKPSPSPFAVAASRGSLPNVDSGNFTKGVQANSGPTVTVVASGNLAKNAQADSSATVTARTKSLSQSSAQQTKRPSPLAPVEPVASAAVVSVADSDQVKRPSDRANVQRVGGGERPEDEL